MKFKQTVNLIDCQTKIPNTMRIFLLLIILNFTLLVKSQTPFEYSLFYNGYWGEQQEVPGTEVMRGTFDNFIIVPLSYHPSAYYMKVTLKNYYKPTKKEMKDRLKRNRWYEFEATVEWFVTNRESNGGYKGESEDAWDMVRFFLIDMGNANYPTIFKKISCTATVKIAPYKKNPVVYNIWFPSLKGPVGIALFL